MREKQDSINKISEDIIFDQEVRRAVTQRSLFLFIKIFLGSYLEYDLAPFQEEMLYLAEQSQYRLIAVMAFRGSGKSTLLNFGYALWSILGVQNKKFVVILSKTRIQARDHFNNIKSELESNDLLKSDLGPFKADDGEWGTYALELPDLGAKIICVSRGQSIRGLIYGKHRPDLIICDDIEDSVSVEIEQARKATLDWFTNEVLPLGSNNTRIIVLGNLLHEESLLMQLKSDIKSGKRSGIFRAYPLLDDNNKVLWPSKFASKNELSDLKRNLSDIGTWIREYLLKIPPEMVIFLGDPGDRPFKRADIQHQQPLLSAMKNYRISAPLVVPSVAFSKEELNQYWRDDDF